ncbi:MAG TPA: ABC transporter substrate-binding protein, partial [Candidatus Bathyarchaeia archaeon]|nr:ABC transporter substrate-binding protein [Candidatus Bathyarchaeia archaeon]
TLTVANSPSLSPSVTVSDAGGATPTGTYNVPCQIAGTYQITSNIYAGLVLVRTHGGQNHAITVRLTYNSVSPSYTAANRYYWGAALAHLLDGPSFVTGFFHGAATHDNCFDPADSIVPCASGSLSASQTYTNADCHLFGDTSNPVLHSWSTTCATNAPLDPSAYNLVSDNINNGLWWTSGLYGGAGVSGHDDLRAACDNFVSMGFALAPSGSNCENVANALSNSTLAAAGYTLANYPHVVPTGQIEWFVRTSAGRKQFGIIMTDTFNAMFGTPNSNGGGAICYGDNTGGTCPFIVPHFYTIGQIAPLIFGDGPIVNGGAGPTHWNLYTGGFTLTSTPDFLYGLFNSVFSGGTCGGAGESQPNNYVFFCNPQFDTDSNAGEFGSSTSFGPLFSRAAVDGLNNAMDVPVYTGIDTFVELNGWNFQQCTGSPCVNTQSSLVNTIGAGTENPFWSLLNARQVPGYSPTNSINAPGGRTGTSDNGIIRYGFSQTTGQLSPFQFTTVWEANVVFEVYDSLLAVNPLVYASSGQLLDWQSTTHSSSFSASATCNSPGTGPVVGCTTQVWKLRNDLKFQDGNPVTAADVAYSILAYRDVPSANLGPSVVNVASAVGAKVGSTETLTVTLALQSPFYELDIGGLPILEKALWAPYCGDPPSSSSPCASLAFDPMTANNPLTSTPGIFVGDGPFSCVVPTGFANAGHVGGSCTESASNVLEGQAVDVGGRILLQRNSLYLRCCPSGTGATSSSLYKLSYADKNNDGVVNIQDLASTAACFGLTAGASNAICTSADSTYWVNSNISPGPAVNINDLATVAFYFSGGAVSFAGNSVLSSMTGIDPQIDPFNCPTTGC